MLAFCVNLPSLGEAKLKHRENPRLLGTDKEHIMLQPEDPWYQVSTNNSNTTNTTVA
jgi:protein transport protein SEC24